MKRHGIQHFASDNEQKAAVVGRFNSTNKTRIWTYLSDRGTVRCVKVIHDLVNSNNDSRHRSIGMAPAVVQMKDESRLLVRLFGDKDTHLKPQIPQGAMVRASSHKTIFDNSSMPNWTKEQFTVNQRCYLEEGLSAAYISWRTTTMKLLEAAGTQRKFRKFQTISTASRKSCKGVLYLCHQKNYLFGGKVGQTSTTRGYRTQTSTMSSMSDEFQVLLPRNVKGNPRNKPNLY